MQTCGRGSGPRRGRLDQHINAAGGDGELAPGLVIDRHTFGDPLGDQAPLEMRDRSEDMNNQLAGGRVRVDPFLQALRRV